MANIKIANFAFLQPAGFVLPGLRTGLPGGKVGLRATEDIYFDLPDDARPRGILSFNFYTEYGPDDGVD
jgi:hypothetical protein